MVYRAVEGVSRQQQSFKGEGGLQKVVNFPFHYSFPVVSFIFNCNDLRFRMNSSGSVCKA